MLILTTFDLDEYVYAALKVGASGFILKDGPAEDWPTPSEPWPPDNRCWPPGITRRVIEEYVRRPAPGAPTNRAVSTLTPRESDVLRALAAGQSNAEIAGALFMGEATVKTHVTSLLWKLGLRDRVQAVVFAYESGFVRAGG